jgi:PEP-CTERM motif
MSSRTDVNNNELYDPATDSLTAKAADVLYMYLMPKLSNNIADAIWSSISNIDNLQHIFYKVPNAGDYKLRVLFQADNASAETNYGLAWWTVTVPEPGTFALMSLAMCGLGLIRKR